MAEVFLATRKGEIGGFSKQVAIKRIYEHLAEDPELITMFFDEGRIAARLNHSNIVQIYDLGQIDGCFYIAMEFVNGCDLRSLCERGLKVGNFIPLPMAVRAIASAATGLHYAHSRHDDRGRALNIVHRDVSPQNILISMDGEIKMCDFGIAKAEARMTQTQTGQFKGKFAYMSPEQVLGEGGVIDRRSDIFSLGIVLYEITVCTRLFRGKNDYDTIRMVAEADVTPPTQVRQGFPPDLERIILKALARRPEHRYQTAEQMQMELEEWLIEHRAKTGPVHISRYMHQVFPELVERTNASLSTQQLQAPDELALAASQLTMQDMDSTQDSFPAESIANEYADADATGEIDVNAFRAALENDQSLDHAYAQAAGQHARPQPQVAQPRGHHISAQWSSAAAGDFEDDGATKITTVDAALDDMDNMTRETPRLLQEELRQSLSSVSPLQAPAVQQKQWAAQPTEPSRAVEPSGQWQGPDSYAQSSGHWSSVSDDVPHAQPATSAPAQQWPSEPLSVPQPVAQQPRPVVPQPVVQQPVALQPAEQPSGHYVPEPQPSGQWSSASPATPQAPQPSVQWPQAPQPQQPAQPQYATQQPAQPHHAQQPVAPAHQPSPAPSLDSPQSDWDVGHTSASMQYDIKALQQKSNRKKIFTALAVVLGLGAVVAVIAIVGVERPPTELSDENKPIDEALLDTPPPEPIARASASISSSPEGAYVVINGIMSDGQTPGDFELAADKPNDIVFMLEGHKTRRVQLEAGASMPDTIELEPAGDLDPARASSIEVTSEPLGALVFHNGIQIGPAPVTLRNLNPDEPQHITLTAKDYHPYSAMMQPLVGEKDALNGVLEPLSLKSREFFVDLSLETVPRGASVSINGKPSGVSPALFKGDRHAHYTITYEAPNYVPLTRHVETREVGTLMIRPRLESISREKGTVSMTVPSSTQDVYLGNNQYKLSELKKIELSEGSHPIVIVTKSGERHETTFDVEPKTHTKYKLEVLNGKARVRKSK